MSAPVRLALVAASPVYYQAPLYRLLAGDPRLDFTAIFASSSGVRAGKQGFGDAVSFDVDTLAGYRSRFLRAADRNEIDTGSFFALRDLDVVRELRRGDYDVLWLHGYSSLTLTLAGLTQLARRRPLLLREEQTLLHPRAWWKRAAKTPLLRILLGRAHALAIGSENRRWFRRYGVPDARIFHVPYCVDNEAMRSALDALVPRHDDLRRALGISPEGGPVIVSVARLVPKKQPLLLLDAFERVRRGRQCTLLLVGSGELEAELRREVAARNIPDVVFAGFVNQSRIAEAYAVSDVFALASGYDETWGIVVNEAMAAGLPVVVSDRVGSAYDLVRNADNGFVVGAFDVDSLADRLGELVDSVELRERMGRVARDRIEAWSYEVAAAGVTAAVASAVGEERWRDAAQAVLQAGSATAVAS